MQWGMDKRKIVSREGAKRIKKIYQDEQEFIAREILHSVWILPPSIERMPQTTKTPWRTPDCEQRVYFHLLSTVDLHPLLHRHETIQANLNAIRSRHKHEMCIAHPRGDEPIQRRGDPVNRSGNEDRRVKASENSKIITDHVHSSVPPCFIVISPALTAGSKALPARHRPQR